MVAGFHGPAIIGVRLMPLALMTQTPERKPSGPDRQLLRREAPWLVADVVMLVILFNANAPELWFWLVVLLVLLAYRYERWWSARPQKQR